MEGKARNQDDHFFSFKEVRRWALILPSGFFWN
jgi:hypothetical protein